MVRAGPPPPKRSYKEAVAGLLGLMLLVASGVLAVTLPEHTPVTPQFKVTFETERVDLPSQSYQFNVSSEKGQRHDFLYNITHDDVLQIKVNVHFTDDLAASDPDTFRFELVDPSGNRQPPDGILSNPVPRQNQSNPSQYDALMATATYTISLAQKPDDTIVDGSFEDTAESVAAEQSRLNRFNTNGTWKVKIFMVSAGGCPTPAPLNPNPDDALRSANCLNANSAQEDPRLDAGNLFTVGSFSYTRFTVNAERLD